MVDILRVPLCITQEKRWVEAKICHQLVDSDENEFMIDILRKFHAKGFPCTQNYRRNQCPTLPSPEIYEITSANIHFFQHSVQAELVDAAIDTKNSAVGTPASLFKESINSLK